MAFIRTMERVTIQFTGPIDGNASEPLVAIAATIKDDQEGTEAPRGFSSKRSDLTNPQQAALDNFLNSMQTMVDGRAGGGRQYKYPHNP